MARWSGELEPLVQDLKGSTRLRAGPQSGAGSGLRGPLRLGWYRCHGSSSCFRWPQETGDTLVGASSQGDPSRHIADWSRRCPQRTRQWFPAHRR